VDTKRGGVGEGIPMVDNLVVHGGGELPIVVGWYTSRLQISTSPFVVFIHFFFLSLCRVARSISPEGSTTPT
jgi:hypothetical protein